MDTSPRPDHTIAERTPDQTMTGLSPGQSSSTGDKKKGSHVKPYALPPCKVCGAKGTGLHYGVNTCEACKVRTVLVVDDNEANQWILFESCCSLLSAYDTCI